MKEKLLKQIKKIKSSFIEANYLNKLSFIFIVMSMVFFCLARKFTVGNFFTLRSFYIDLSVLFFIVTIGYFLKPKNTYRWYMFVTIFLTLMEITNVIYYKFYNTYASFGEFASLAQAETVSDSVFAKTTLMDFCFALAPFLLYYINKHLNKTNYRYILEKIGFRKKMLNFTAILASLLMIFVISTSTNTDLSRLTNQWNRISTVERFSLLFYQLNDLVLTVTPKLFSFIGYDNAALIFNEYYENYEPSEPNEYTGILEDKNIIFVHVESVQTFLMYLSYNDVEVTPNLNQLAEEGMFFSNFHPQISTGTSSDSEFTLLTSLMPASSGTVFVSYYKNEYVTVPKILSELDYYTFSMHGNNFSMWNRMNAHPSLGYNNFFFEESYEYDESDILGLGINDLMFFEQSFDYLLEIDNNNEQYMGTIITLSNHSPFTDAANFWEYDYKYYSEYEDENGEIVEVVTDNLSNSTLSNFLTSVSYGDYALGEFMNMIRESDNFNDTLFVFYGDHDAKYSESNMKKFLSYNPETGEFDLEVSYDTYDHELNKSTPLIFWTKNEELREIFTGEYDYPFGMIDLSPTLLNMFGLENKYALGNDIFNIKNDNVVVFPSSNFLTENIYYNSSTGEYKTLKEGVIIDEDYIEKFLEIVETQLKVSNAIIVYDLIAKEKDKDDEE